jgi:(2Fe-2S) ferredoxin
MNYPFDKLFLICIGKSCNAPEHGEERGECIQESLKAHNKAMGRKESVRVCRVTCLDLCDHGPNMVVEPQGTVYSHLDLARARKVYDGELGDGPPTPEYELSEDEFRAGTSAAAKRT